MIEPFTVSACTEPVDALDRMVAAKPSISSRLPAGTWILRSLRTPWGLPSVSTSMWVRVRSRSKLQPARPGAERARHHAPRSCPSPSRGWSPRVVDLDEAVGRGAAALVDRDLGRGRRATASAVARTKR